MKSTRRELVELLVQKQKKLGRPSLNLKHVIDRARKGKYHDWDSDLATPKIQLVMDLGNIRGVDVTDIIRMVQDGEFDEEPTPEQLEELRAEVGPEMYDKLFPEDAKKRGEA